MKSEAQRGRRRFVDVNTNAKGARAHIHKKQGGHTAVRLNTHTNEVRKAETTTAANTHDDENAEHSRNDDDVDEKTRAAEFSHYDFSIFFILWGFLLIFLLVFIFWGDFFCFFCATNEFVSGVLCEPRSG